MKKRLHGKKACTITVFALLIVSLIETVVRALQPNYAFSVTDLGEPFAIAIFAVIILIYTFMKKDRICYICYIAFISWFLLEEFLSLPGTIKTLADTIINAEAIAAVANGSATMPIVSIVIHLLTSISIVAIGVLVLEYLTDGSIYKNAFNVFCIIAILLLLSAIVINIIGFSVAGTVEIGLLILNNFHRIIMIFMFTCFAYDIAKKQLGKVNFDK